MSITENIVDAIIKDLKDRRGLRHQWENIDEDVQRDIRDAWVGLATRCLRDAFAGGPLQPPPPDPEIAKLDALIAQAKALQTEGPALPLRAMIAAQMMAGAIAHGGFLGMTYEEVEAKRAIKFADALLAALDKPQRSAS